MPGPLTHAGECYLTLDSLGLAQGLEVEAAMRLDGEQLLDAPGGPWVRAAYLEWAFPELLVQVQAGQAPAPTCVPKDTARGAQELRAAGFTSVRCKGAGNERGPLFWTPPGTGRLLTEDEALRLLLGETVSCPFCQRPALGRRCWKCCVAVCECGRVTESAFLTVCRQCEVEEARRQGIPY